MCSKTIVRLLCVGIVCWAGLPAAGSQSQWGHYPVNQDDFRDFSGNDRHGTACDGAVTMFDTQRGWVGDFTQSVESSPRIQLSTEDPAGPDELSISAWVRWFGTDGRWQGIAGKSLNAANRGWVLQLRNTDGELCWPDNPTGVFLDRDRWVHVVVTFHEGTARVYIDGRRKCEVSGVALPRSGNWTAAYVTIGHAEDVAQWFNGYLDDIYFFNKALSGAEAEDLFYGTAPSFLRARDPVPPAGATSISSPLLRWTAGDTAVFHDVYFGSTCHLGPANLVGPRTPMTLYYHVPGLQPGRTYCWRVDEIDQNGTVYPGEVWCFTTGPGPAPARGIVNPCCDPALTWPPVPGAAMYHVYFGENASEVGARAPAADKGTTPQTTLPVGTLQSGTTYYWCVDALSADGTWLTGTVSSFTTPVCTVGAVLREWWLDAPETVMDELLNNPRYDGSPDGRECLNCMEDPTDRAANYVSRFSALLVPPISGNYIFTAESRDGARLWLSSDDDPAHLVLVPWVETISGPSGLSQRSAPQTLSEGKKYYIRVAMKAGLGNDHLSVFWLRPGAGARELICAPYVENPLSCAPSLAYQPHPADGRVNVDLSPVLMWQAGQGALQHDVYFSTHYDSVANATPLMCGVYAGRQSGTAYDPGTLEPGVTYYWRVDEVGAGDPPSVQRGCVWTFTTTDCVESIDDFESYGPSTPLEIKWQGQPNPVNLEGTIVHGDTQSLRMDYDNHAAPYSSEAAPRPPLGANWALGDATTLSLWLHGRPPKFMETSPKTYLMSGSGAGMWGTADEFRFAYTMLSGSGSIAARVQRIGNTSSAAKVGVMIRETLDPGSRHAMLVLTPDGGMSFQFRPSTSGPSEAVTQPDIHTPFWVRMTYDRAGEKLVSEFSLSGSGDWQHIDGWSAPLDTPAPVYIGLVVTSQNPDDLAVAVFSHVSPYGPWQVADIGAAQPGNDPGLLYLRVKDTVGTAATVFHGDNPWAVLIDDWRPWRIPLNSFTGVNLALLNEVALGVSNPATPPPAGTGQIYVDDICRR